MTTSQSPGNSSAFFFQAGISFAAAVTAVGIGLYHLPVDGWVRGFLAVGVLYAVTSTFTLAKCVRDAQEVSALSRDDQDRLRRLLEDVASREQGGRTHLAAPQ